MNPPDTLTITQSYAALGDPHICSDFRDRRAILSTCYESLVQRSATGDFVAALAEHWELGADACTWRFDLRAQVHFHNGDTLHAADVVASLERVCDPALGGELGTQGVYLSYLDGARFQTLSPLCVQIITAKPLADLLDLLVDMPIVPRRGLAGLPQTPVGSGPYQITTIEDQRIICTAFNDYWGVAPRFKQLIWRAEADSGRRVDLLLTGEADLASGLGPQDAERTRAAGLQVPTTLSGLCVILMLNASQGPCRDVRVRQALNYATNVPALVQKVVAGAAEPLNGPLTRLHLAHNPATPAYSHDPTRARQLLAEAGYSSGLQIRLDIPTIYPDEAIPLANTVAEQWAAAGVTTAITTHTDRPGYADMVRAKQIGDACIFDSSPLSSIRVLCEKIHSGIQGPWWEGYHNSEVDQLIDAARATVETTQRHAIYHQAYGIIRNDAPWVFLYSPILHYGVGPRIAGWQPGMDGLVKPNI